jgi:hypothetical protein
MMTAGQREMLDRLFAEGVAVPRDQQPAFLTAHCDDPEVRRELESLLAFATQPLAGVTDAILHTAKTWRSQILWACGWGRTA